MSQAGDTGSMRAFGRLVERLDALGDGADAVDAIERGLRGSGEDDLAWAARLLAGHAPRRALTDVWLRETACAIAGIDRTLFDACRDAAGDLAETVARLLPPPRQPAEPGLADGIEQLVLPMRSLGPAGRHDRFTQALDRLGADSRLLLVRLLCGRLRPPVSARTVQLALARVTGVGLAPLALRLADGWPAAGDGRDGALPRCLEPPARIEASPADGGEPWLVLELPAGELAQFVRRGGRLRVWLPGDRLVDDVDDGLAAAAAAWPDGTVVEGWLAADRSVLDVTALLEWGGLDLAGEPLARQIAARARLPPDPRIRVPAWQAAAAADLADRHRDLRRRGARGLLLGDARADRPGDRAGGRLWWPAAPLRLQGRMLYAQPSPGGSGVEVTVAVRSAPQRQAATAAAAPLPAADGGATAGWVPIARVLVDAAHRGHAAVKAAIEAETVERFGPARGLRPNIAVTVEFDDVSRAPRRRSGVALNNARIVAVGRECDTDEADALDAVTRWLDPGG